MDNNFLSGGISELQDAKAAIAEAGELQSLYNAAEAAASGKEKELEGQKKYVNDKVSSVVKERRTQLKKVHDEQVDLASRNLKDAEKKRKAAKTDAVQTRINNETSGYVGSNEDLKKKIKMLFRENKVPGFCNTKFYYALYAPRSASDFFILVLTVLIAFGLIPNVVCFFLRDKEVIIRVLIYLAIVVFFVALYFIVFAISKRNTKGGILEMARPYRTQIKENKKNIKKTSKTIERDTDESTYGLENYDAEIIHLQSILSDKMQKRDEALKNFDEVTAVEIRAEIEKENQPVIEKLEAELMGKQAELSEAKEKAAASADYLTNTYEIYLGKKNMTPEKIDRMIAEIQEGNASTVMEALNHVGGEIR